VFKHMLRVWKIDLPATEKLVLLGLACRANNKNQCFPTVDTLSKDTGLSRREIFRSLSALKVGGLVEIGKKTTDSSKPPVNLYTLILGGSEGVSSCGEGF
jgi:GntR family transcriptional regulator